MRPSVCKNGATCINTVGSYSCICVNGWSGPDCSENIDDCAGAACFNGATCHDRVGSFYCQCAPGKTGMYFLCLKTDIVEPKNMEISKSETFLIEEGGRGNLPLISFSYILTITIMVIKVK